jgi:glycosyltransferase involved in cell wall biosynthesis
MRKKIVVFSGVNFTEGGPLSIIKDATAKFLQLYAQEFHLILLVHKSELFKEHLSNQNITILEYPRVKGSYLLRLYFEWIKCLSISKKYSPYLWFALHDITPNVRSEKRAVYCHNPAPFFKITKHQALMDKTFFLHHILYKFFYRVNIKRNHFVVVQQLWMKKAFEKNYHINNVIVAHPNFKILESSRHERNATFPNQIFTFFYPAFPRVFKNFEVIFKAIAILNEDNPSFQIVITLNGEENAYSSYLKKTYGHISQVKFIGVQTRSAVLNLMQNCDCVLFPSKLETWGLPLTEAKYFSKPVIASDLPYAYETLEGYDKVSFFPPDDFFMLAKKMREIMLGRLLFSKSKMQKDGCLHLDSWEALFKFILKY